MHRLSLVLLVVAACAGATADSSTSAPDTTTAPVTTQAPAPAATQPEPTTTTMAATTTTAGEPALSQDGSVYMIDWSAVSGPFWDPSAGTADSPFFFIHTQPDVDGFYFGLEMYTTGYGALWQGELGDVAIICNEAAPGPNSTGICPHFDPDGPGPLGNLNADFGATGSITINQLDDGGYDIVINEVVFSDGSTIASFTLTGP